MAYCSRMSWKVVDFSGLYEENDLRVLFQQNLFRDEGCQNYLVVLLLVLNYVERKEDSVDYKYM